MSEYKFTPGPWRIVDDVLGSWQIRAYQGPLDVSPARAHGYWDAKLIAAAPELVAALEGLAQIVNDYLYTTSGTANDVDYAIETARALLARIKGDEA